MTWNTKNKKAWESVRIESKGKKLRREDFLLFCSSYRVARQRVGSWTAEEKIDLIYKALDYYWRAELCKHIDQKSAGRYWVKIPHHPGYDKDDARRYFEVLFVEPSINVEEHKLGYLIDCKNSENQDLAIKLPEVNIVLKGIPIKLATTTCRQTGDEILD